MAVHDIELLLDAKTSMKSLPYLLYSTGNEILNTLLGLLADDWPHITPRLMAC